MKKKCSANFTPMLKFYLYQDQAEPLANYPSD